MSGLLAEWLGGGHPGLYSRSVVIEQAKTLQMGEEVEKRRGAEIPFRCQSPARRIPYNEVIGRKTVIGLEEMNPMTCMAAKRAAIINWTSRIHWTGRAQIQLRFFFQKDNGSLAPDNAFGQSQRPSMSVRPVREAVQTFICD